MELLLNDEGEELRNAGDISIIHEGTDLLTI